VWTPNHSLNDRKIDQFLVVSRSVGTFARALDCSSSVKQPSLHMSAAAASRDITLVCIVLMILLIFNAILRLGYESRQM
jgi:ELM2 domain